MNNHYVPSSNPLAADFDHTSFAVDDALRWARKFRSELGAVPVIGESVDEFRYLMMYLGTATRGTKIELIEPTGPGFLTKYLDQHGQGPHHLTFTVPNIIQAAARARSLGFTVVGENFNHLPWQECFILPGTGHRVVVQLAATNRRYLDLPELLATQERDAISQPHVREGSDRSWWTPLWSTPIGLSTLPGPTRLASGDLGAADRLFGELLGGQVSWRKNSVEYCWKSGCVEVVAGSDKGITALTIEHALQEPWHLGQVEIGARRTLRTVAAN